MPRRTYGTGSLRLSDGIYHIRFRDENGKPREESAKTGNLKHAEQALRRRLSEVEGGTYVSPEAERLTIRELCLLVDGEYERRNKRDIEHVRQRRKAHIEPLVGNRAAVKFGTTDINQYIAKRRAQGAADTTINRELAVIRRGYSLAIKHTPPLLLRAPHIELLPEDNVRKGFIEPEQYRVIRDEMPAHLKCLFVVAYHIGMRLGELRRLRWDQVDLSTGEIRLEGRQTKNGEARTAPIYGEMGVWLRIQREERDAKIPECPWVFHYHGRPIGHHVGGWAEACERAGVPNLWRHDLRRTAVRNMVRAGVPEAVAMSITGHKTRSIFARYNIVSGRDVREAGRMVEAYLNEQAAAAIVGDCGGGLKKEDAKEVRRVQ